MENIVNAMKRNIESLRGVRKDVSWGESRENEVYSDISSPERGSKSRHSEQIP
jgi:hypothetical protein